MAINFEAANMAGYNNPRIEVFKAVYDSSKQSFTNAPLKPEIISCLNRGAIPVILMATVGADAEYMFMLFGHGIDGAGSIIFHAGGFAVGTDMKISYASDSDTPVFSSAT